EAIALLKKLAQKEDFTLKTIPYPVPGTNQQSAWASVRRFKPDHVLVWGAGPGNTVSLRTAISYGVAPEELYFVVWLSETNMEPFENDAVKGVKRFAGVLSGTDTPILQHIVNNVVEPGQGSGKRSVV